MEDSFYIGAYWGSRQESLKQITNKILDLFGKLGKIDEQFISWYEGGSSRKKALEKKVTFDSETIEKLCLTMVKKGELDSNGISKMGYLFGLWTGQDDRESSNIAFNVGASFKSPYLCNSCVLKIPFDGIVRQRLLQTEKAKLIISLFIDIWSPDYAVLTSRSLRDKLNAKNDIGWITYRKSIKTVPKISNRVIHEKSNEGDWFYLDLQNLNYDIKDADDLLPIKESL